MLKWQELASPNSCLNKANENEMLFVLLSRDPAFATTVRFWVAERIRLGVNREGDEKMTSAVKCAEWAENGGA